MRLQSAVFAMCFAVVSAVPARAGVITDVTKTWLMNHCETHYWTPPDFPTSTTVCITGEVDFGYSASLAAYGYTYDFTSMTLGSAPPAGSFFDVGIDCIEFTETPYTAGTCLGLSASIYPGGLGNGQFFNPPFAYPGPGFDANSSLEDVQGEYAWVDSTYPVVPGCPECGSSFQNGFFMALVLTPEPATLTLMSSGLFFLVLWGLKRRSKRQA